MLLPFAFIHVCLVFSPVICDTKQANLLLSCWIIRSPFHTKSTYLDQAVIFAVIQVFPCALFPVLVRHHTRFPRNSTSSALSPLPFSAGRALNSRFSFDAILSINTWRSLGSSLPRAALVTFGSFTAITAITTWCPRRPRLTVNTRDTTIMESRRLLDWNKKNVMSDLDSQSYVLTLVLPVSTRTKSS